MEKPTQKVCPVCSKIFSCNAADITHCDCYQVKLTNEAQKKIGEQFTDCLCKDCLQKINNDITPLLAL